MTQLMPLPLIISCSSKSRLVRLPSWFYFSEESFSWLGLFSILTLVGCQERIVACRKPVPFIQQGSFWKKLTRKTEENCQTQVCLDISKSSADAERLCDTPQIQNITLEKACNMGMTFKVITIYQIGHIQVSLLVRGLLLQHLYLAPCSTVRSYYHFFSVLLPMTLRSLSPLTINF